ncbi:hypothetical protein [Kordia sp.]|uniref:hypothetical protein n=1 Tax=Kordia sp. TaxID=1965332 RepID=UPI0025C6C7FD|nr:hypothetical protein [Kordia sp.]MCH2194298.1 hypothetical protein [Kordia sp.]
MKKTSLLLLIFISLTAFTCENEALDDGVEETANTNNTNNPGTLLGTWRAVSLEADIQTTTTILGIPISTTGTITGVDLDYTVTFTENTYVATGDYSIESSFSIAGEAPTTTTQSLTDQTNSGNYEDVGNNTIVTNDPFFTITTPGVDTSAITGEPQQLTYQLSADGQTLTFVQDQQEIQTQDGIEYSVDVSSVSVFSRE